MQNTIVEDDIITETQQNLESADTPNESLLADEITSLWSAHVQAQTNQRATSKELRQIRRELAERLHSMKAFLCRPGCGGEWSGWLAERNIPRSTADRLVARHEEAQNGVSGNLPSESITGQEEVERLVQSLMPRLRRALTTDEIAYQFVCALAKELNLNHTVGDNSLVLMQPIPYQNTPSEYEDGALEMVGQGVS